MSTSSVHTLYHTHTRIHTHELTLTLSFSLTHTISYMQPLHNGLSYSGAHPIWSPVAASLLTSLGSCRSCILHGALLCKDIHRLLWWPDSGHLHHVAVANALKEICHPESRKVPPFGHVCLFCSRPSLSLGCGIQFCPWGYHHKGEERCHVDSNDSNDRVCLSERSTE